uniref:ImmA/IrrE family metallo-endopeptidase n=1 Tax=Herbidospora sakaeratensis TaxID=564415 RepID=UPI00078265D4|nr:ImmA/IrrE family metallo-endopeptidase [Herbidospora sakaeratensis]
MTATLDLGIRWDWEPAPSVRAAELKATWARIEISVGPDHVTLVEDHATGASRRSIYCPLYPLAEWIAYNWWFIQADARLARNIAVSRPEKFTSRAFFRHSMRGSGDGFLWPNLIIIPEGAGKRLLWYRDRGGTTAQSPIRFLAEGEATLDGEQVNQELSRVVSAVLTRLREQGVTGTPLEKEWESIEETSPDEAAYCRAAARLGLDPYSEAEPYEDLIIEAADRLQGHLLGDFYDAVEPDRMNDALIWLTQAQSTIEKITGPADAVSLRADLGPLDDFPGDRAWEIGWKQARAVRRSLGLDDTDLFLTTRFVTNVSGTAVDPGLRAVGGARAGSGPVAVIRSGLETASRRFTLARALWHFLNESDSLFLITNAHTDRQRMERAFATELLAPAKGIAEMLGRSPDSVVLDDIEELASRFQVSPSVIKHQLENQVIGP